VLAARVAAAIAPDHPSKVWRSLRARRDVVSRFQAKAKAVRDLSRPLVWFHAPSVGEGLQARPVAHALRAAQPTVQQAYTFFSPSAERFAASVGAEITEYLPFDGVQEADALLDALRPAVLVFVKLDVWPVLVERAAARGVPVALLSATLAPDSGRRGRLSRLLLHDAYAALSAVGAIDEANAERLIDLGAPRAVTQVTGDTRFDQVRARANDVDSLLPLLRALASTRPTLVAGSTWPSDETVLFEAWRNVKIAIPDARLIIAPHEPTSEHLEPIRRWVVRAGLAHATLSDVEHIANAGQRDVIIVDRVGVLGDVYALATAAFVGGGFHAAGLHSVIEPAAFGAPVVFGPQWRMSREAALLQDCGGGVSVPSAEALAITLRAWLGDPDARDTAGHAARALVQQELGATQRSLALVEQLLGR